MSFLNPLFLIGMAALAVPLLIHIINLRKPQSIPFSTLAFFEELKKSTIRRIRIKRYLLLLLRCAAIILLALALARPFIPSNLVGGGSGQQPTAVAILVDNSPSMNQIDKQGPFLEQAKATARKFIEQSREKDRFLIQKTNGGPLDSRLVSASSADALLQQVEVEQKGSYFGERLQAMRDKLEQSSLRRAAIYVFSDFQQSQWSRLQQTEFSNTASGSKYVGLQFIKVGSQTQKNAAITDISLQSQMLSKDKPVTIQVKVRNFADEPLANQFISLQIEGEMTGQYQTDLEERSSKEILFEFVPEKSGELKGKVVLEGDPVPFDNQRYFVLDIPATRSALLVRESQDNPQYSSYLPTTLKAAEQTGSQLTYTEVKLDNLSVDDWKTRDVIIFDGVGNIPEYLFSDLQNFVQEGNGIVVFPSEKGEVQNYNRFFQLFNAGKYGGLRGEYGRFKSVSRLENIKEGHPIINQLFDKEDREEIKVDRPEIFFNYQYETNPGSNALMILRSSIDDPLLIEHSFGNGRLLISSIGTDPGWSNFPVNPLFAPVFYRSILYAASSEKGGISQHTLGTPLRWTGSLPEPVVTLTQQQKVKPEVKQVADGYHIRYPGQDWTPGWLTLSSGTFQRSFALNLSRRESNFDSIEQQEADTLFGSQVKIAGFQEINTPEDADRVIQSAGIGKEIWHWFIWAALILLMAETFISRWYKAESV